MRKMSTVQKCAFVTAIVAMLSSQGLADAKLDELVSQKKYDEAISYVNSNLTPQKRTLKEWMQLADAYLQTKNENRALATYILAGRMNPKDGAPLAGAASIYFDQKNFEKAESFGKKAFDLTPDAESAWQYARAAIKLGKPVEAKKALEKVIAADPTNVAANSSLGQIYYDEKEYAKASTLLEVAYQNGPSQDLAYKIALSYKNSNNIVKAKEYYDLAVKDNSKLYKAMVERAEIAYGEKEYSRSFVEFGRASKGLKLTAIQQYKYALSAEKEGKAETTNLYRSAVKLFGADKGTEALAARLYVADKDYAKKDAKQAADHYKFYLGVKGGETKSAVIWYKLAEMQVLLNAKNEAVVSLNKAIELDKTHVSSYALLADLYAQLGQDAKSESTLEGLIQQNQSDPSVYLKLGDYKLSKKEYTPALANYEKSQTLKPSVEASRGIALSAAELKQWTKVIPAAKAVLAQNGDLPVRKVYATALVETNAFADAKPEITKVLSAEPKNISFWKMQLKASEVLTDKALGLSADSALVALEPKNVTSRKRYLAFLIEQKDAENAFPIAVELTKLEVKEASHFKTASKLAEVLKKTDDAITYLEGYLALNPSDVKGVVRLGEYYYAAKRFDDALAQYRAALKLNSQPEGFPYDHYAELVIKNGQTDEVIKALTGLVETGKADAGTYNTLGMLHKNKKQYAKAIPMYENALALNPADLAANIALGECQQASGDLTMAIVSFEQAVMMNPDSAIGYQKLGDAYSKSGDNALAMTNYRMFIDKGGVNSTVAYRVGTDAYAKKEYELAAKALLQVKGANADSFDRQKNLAISLFEAKRYKEAIEWSRIVIKRNPKAATKKQLLKNIGMSYEGLGNFSQAMKEYDLFVNTLKFSDKDVEYKRAFLREKNYAAAAKKIYRNNISRYPSDMRNYLQLGKMLSNSSNPAELKEGAKYLEKVLASASANDAELLLTVAEAYGKANLPEKELVAYQRYSEVKPNDVAAYVRVGELQMERGKYSDAVISFELASSLDPKRVDILLMTAQAYSYMEDWGNAIAVLETARPLDPNNTEVLKLLVDAYMNSGNKEKARTILKGLVDEGDPKYLTMYARFLLEENDYKGAMKIVDGMLEIFAEDPQALVLKGEILRAQGDNNGAAELMKYATELDPYYAVANYELAETYAVMSGAKKRFALRFYDKAVAINPEYGEAWYGKAMLAKLFKMDAEYKTAITNALKFLPADPKVQKEAKAAGILK